jgi:hypothetical protein
MHRRITGLLCLLVAQPLHAAACDIDLSALEFRIEDLESAYGDVTSDISCDLPTLPVHRMMCDSAEAADDALWRMGRLDDLAWIYALENATGLMVDIADPPRDESFLATRDACTDPACLCRTLIEHTNDSLGGTSPYPQ